MYSRLCHEQEMDSLTTCTACSTCLTHEADRTCPYCKQTVCAVTSQHSTMQCCAGSFKHAHGDYSTAIMALAALSAFTCLLTASFVEPDKHSDLGPITRKAHNVAV